ncbi:MAG: PH domain-containing protein [Candidatus Cyclonatronum sp.]|uniref:PH domain-containing protein n=1 Tax=Cyclonatronum sp. TaxID=3024185 RepID=UPI0025C310B4|nr:PH domain-containing protein [Cyclonatronum sp.]MCC5932923.1 PH domain-containing protein [Balneolales bacterium]MCH8486598.1 PH domain-containing protein [Cyclonatronum sp.]
MAEEKAILYKTHPGHFKKEFRKAFWQIFLLGFGFIEISKLRRRIKNTAYRVFNDRIELKDPALELDEVIRIEDLLKVRRTQSADQSKYGLCDLHLETAEKKLVMTGIEKGEQLEDVLYIAIEKNKRRKAMQERAKGDYTDFRVGGLENMNDLVGMWQQGLISDEDFEAEQRKNRNQPN